MFSITEDAEIYVAELFEQQDEKNLGLKVDVEKAGTPVATVTFNFCITNDLPKSYNEYPYNGFSAYIDDSNDEYLKDSKVDMKIDGATKKLTSLHRTLKVTLLKMMLHLKRKYYLQLSPKLTLIWLLMAASLN